ncbi:MAG TPA: gamma-glutamylcyclotransferase family protein [Acidisphaera sp.]|nr:gamma-glutamylcyclotransferase family protein [Acidisphaera sp.]
MRVFLYGTLLDPATLAARSGDPRLPARCRPAALQGWRRVALAGSPYPTLRPARGTRTPGVVVDVGPAALRRLVAYEGPAYRLTRLVVATAQGETAVHAWIAPGGTQRPWNPEPRA